MPGETVSADRKIPMVSDEGGNIEVVMHLIYVFSPVHWKYFAPKAWIFAFCIGLLPVIMLFGSAQIPLPRDTVLFEACIYWPHIYQFGEVFTVKNSVQLISSSRQIRNDTVFF